MNCQIQAKVVEADRPKPILKWDTGSHLRHRRFHHQRHQSLCHCHNNNSEHQQVLPKTLGMTSPIEAMIHCVTFQGNRGKTLASTKDRCLGYKKDRNSQDQIAEFAQMQRHTEKEKPQAGVRCITQPCRSLVHTAGVLDRLSRSTCRHHIRPQAL